MQQTRNEARSGPSSPRHERPRRGAVRHAKRIRLNKPRFRCEGLRLRVAPSRPGNARGCLEANLVRLATVATVLGVVCPARTSARTWRDKPRRRRHCVGCQRRSHEE